MIKENEIIVIDDVIDQEYQESIKDILKTLASILDG